MSDNGNISQVKSKIVKEIKKIVARYGLDDEEWSQAISSQYFLLCLAKKLKWAKKDYTNLLNKCLASFSVTYTGDYILDNEKLLITPDETTRIIKCMQEEDNEDNYYTHSAKMQAKNINSSQMYLNFHYGLLVRIVSSENTEVLCALKHKCLDRLINDNALDTSDGWYPYRVPWITARILISLEAIDYSSYPNKEVVDDIINTSINSLYQRIDEKAPYWRSGVGKWVTKWESTALCLEALYVWKTIDKHIIDIKRIIDYVCSEENKSVWLNNPISFATEDAANDALSAVILASVVYRITSTIFANEYYEVCEEIITFFEQVITIINRQAVDTVRQYCTIPQILYYVFIAIEDLK